MDIEKMPQVENDRPSSEAVSTKAIGDANHTTFLDTEGSQSSEAAGPTSKAPDTSTVATYHNPTPPLPEAGKHSYRLRRGRSWGLRFRRYWDEDVDPKWADLLLILCFFTSGVVDSVAFNVWSCFASMQTGNTILVGLGASSQPFTNAPYGWAKCLVAILSFCLGCVFFGHFHRFLGPLKRRTMVGSFGIQVTFMIIAATLATVGVVSQHLIDSREFNAEKNSYAVNVPKINWHDLAPLALLSFGASGQAIASRALKYNELPTVVLTSLYCDMLSDPMLFKAGIREDPRRNRRAVAAVVLFAGAVSGGFLTKSWVGLPGALWLATFLKGCILLAWIFWRGAPPPPDDRLAR